jgi:hypothetical protein
MIFPKINIEKENISVQKWPSYAELSWTWSLG